VVLADEPTGALDSVAAQWVIDLLRDASRQGQTIVMVTHDASVAAAAHDVVHMVDGALQAVL
jgi:putative ABC transport system ATP-binding protein